MSSKIKLFIFFISLSLITGINLKANAQDNNPNVGLIRIAEPGQLADTLNLWGDVGAPGRYLVPRGTTLTQLISFGGGPSGVQSDNSPWGKIRLQVNISKFDKGQNKEITKSYKFKYSDPIPRDLRTYRLSNEEVVTLQVKKRPAFIDVLGVVGPILSTITAVIIINDQIIK